jgi:hypothetical protein
MTLSEMASAVRNHADGLMAYLQHLFSEQLQDEILLTTSAVIVKLSAQGWILIN